MSAKVGHIANRFERILPKHEHTGFQALEATENLQHVFPVVRDMHGLVSTATLLNFLMIFQVLVSQTTISLLPGFGCSTEKKHLDPSTEKAT